MAPIFKSRNKAEVEEQQRRYYWGLTPHERVALALRLNQQARFVHAANPANPPAPAPSDGRRVFKSTAPVPRRGR